MNRKKHSGEGGYIAERANPFVPTEKVVIYVSTEQNADPIAGKYMVVCDAHGTFVNTTSIPNARILMKNPDNFCDECRVAAGEEI